MPTTAVTALIVVNALLTLGLALAGVALVILTRKVAELENDMLGVRYDCGLHAITLEEAGLPIHDDTRELAHFARLGLPGDPR